MDIEPGCYVDGHWGHYGIARQIEVCADLGADWPTKSVDVAMAESYHQDPDSVIFDELVDAADEAEDALNAILPSLYRASWHDGEFFIEVDEPDYV